MSLCSPETYQGDSTKKGKGMGGTRLRRFQPTGIPPDTVLNPKNETREGITGSRAPPLGEKVRGRRGAVERCEAPEEEEG